MKVFVAIVRRVVKVIDKITGNVALVAAWVILPLIFASVFEVVSRYIFNAPTIWAYEIGYMATGVNFLLGSAFTLRERAHIRIDLLYSRLDPKWESLIDAAGYILLFLPFSFWLSYRLGIYALEAYNSGELSGQSAWNPLIWPFRAIFFLGFSLLSLQAAAELIRSILVLAGAGNTSSGGSSHG